MSSEGNKGLYTDGTEPAPRVAGIPLTEVDTHARGTASIGTLVQDATQQLSSLVRSEIELAKAEIAGEAKKGAIGGGLFAVAGVVALYSSFFFFFFVAALLAVWLPWWAAFLIVFVAMLLVAGAAAFVGYKKVTKIKAPEKTIESVQELKTVVPSTGKPADSGQGLYT